MAARVEVLWGLDSAPVRAAEMAYVEHLQATQQRGLCGTGLWLVPTFRVQRLVLQRLALQTHGCFQPNVFTFSAFADQLLTTMGEPVTPLSTTAQRRLLRVLVNRHLEAGELRYFRGIAGTGGFLDLLAGFIADLKQDENWPEHFTAALKKRGHVADRDRELASLYQTYQDALLEHHWYDSEGRFWLARDSMSQGIRGRFAAVELVTLTGFADFTRTQLEMLGYLAAVAQRIVLQLPGDPDSPREELFARPRGTWNRLRESLPEDCEVRVTISRSPSSSRLMTQTLNFLPEAQAARGGSAGASPSRKFSADIDSKAVHKNQAAEPVGLRKIREELFGNLRTLQPESAGEEIEFITAIGPHSEIDAVAVRVKRLLQVKVPAEDILIATRLQGAEMNSLARALSQAGLPIVAEVALRLADSPIVKALVQLLRMEASDWSFTDVLAVLHSSLLRPAWQTRAAASDLAMQLRHRKLSGRRSAILQVLQAALTHDEPPAGLVRAAALAQRLSRELESLRHAHTFAEWVNILAVLVREFRLIGTPGEPFTEDDRRDWDFLQRVLRSAAETDAQLQPTLPNLDLAEFLEQLTDLVTSETLPAQPEPNGCVRLLPVTQARHLDIPYLFVMGLTEGTFPQPARVSCFYNDHERRQLNEHGLSLRHQHDVQQDEQFLFASLLTRAGRRLCLSYAAVDQSGEPRFPSPYLISVRELFSNAAERTRHEGDLDPVPGADRIVSPADFRLAAVAAARAGETGWLARLCTSPQSAEAGRNILAALHCAVERFHTPGFSPFEGQLTSPRGLAQLQQRFGASHSFSATQLEEYANCPFRYFMSHVLEIDPLESPELATDTQRRGVIIHRIAATLLGNQQPTRIDAARLSQQFRERVEIELRQSIHDSALLKAFNRIEQQLLAEWGEQFASQHEAYSQKLRTEWLEGVRTFQPEVPFGKVPEEELAQADAGEHYRPLKFGSGAQQVTVSGKIDRIDYVATPEGTQFAVIDYKTGKPPSFKPEDVGTGKALQLMLYTLAVRRLGMLGDDAWPFQMGYWSVREKGFETRLKGSKGAKWQSLDRTIYLELERTLDELIPRLVDGIRNGVFVVDSLDDNCTGYCPYRTVCRVNQIRPLAESLRKWRYPPTAAPVEEDA